MESEVTNEPEVEYLAELKIERIERPVRGTGPQPPKRERTEVTKLIVKANTLSRLVDRLGKHIEIIEEG